MKVFMALSVLVLAVVVYQTNGLCNTCTVGGIACVANNQFQFCNEGQRIEPVFTCPAGMLCTPVGTVCTNNPNTLPSCARCQTCDDNKIFACTKYNAFSLCSGNTDYDHTVEYICPRNLVCNVDLPEICVDESITGIDGTCPLESAETQSPPTSTTTTTARPNAPTHPNEFCASIRDSGNYKIPTDETCTYYIQCGKSGDSWTGTLYVCPRGRYFNETVGRCAAEKPDRCF